jgi:apolipoprotein D and lipocalin family protein
MFPAVLANVLMADTASAPNNRPVTAFELQRCLGTWHEIAHLPTHFQRRCIDQVTATCTARKDGRIRVRNACRNEVGSIDESVGLMRAVADHPGQLQLTYVPVWLSWLPLVWTDYWVIDLDPDYRWTVVGGPSRKHLWVLARGPTMNRSLFERIKTDAQARGYPVEGLIMTAPLD